MVITREELLEAEHEADVSTETDPSKDITDCDQEPDSTTPNASPQKLSTKKRTRSASCMAKTICAHIATHIHFQIRVL